MKANIKKNKKRTEMSYTSIYITLLNAIARNFRCALCKMKRAGQNEIDIVEMQCDILSQFITHFGCYLVLQS